MRRRRYKYNHRIEYVSPINIVQKKYNAMKYDHVNRLIFKYADSHIEYAWHQFTKFGGATKKVVEKI